MTLDIAVTATRRGLTSPQRECAKLNLAFHLDQSIVFRHGMCSGGDTELHHIARDLGITAANGHRIEGHPGHSRNGASPFFTSTDVDLMHEPLEYLARDDIMVDLCHVLWGFPGTVKPVQRGSGTWYTIRYARKIRKPLLIVYPNGSMRWENMPEDDEC